MKKKKEEISADELLNWLKDKRVITHTDRRFCLHNLSMSTNSGWHLTCNC